MKQIFLVEDDREIAKNLTLLLQAEGYGVVHASGQAEAAAMVEKARYDLALVDISLPDGSGFVVCTQIRQMQKIPVIFLTASGDEASVVTGLNMGADDYVIKPFRPRELIARIQAALRKSGTSSGVTEVCGLSVDTGSGLVKKNGKEIFLSALEYRLFLIFVSNPERVITRDRLLNELWDAAGEYVNDNTLTVYIKRLREKIEEDPANPVIIRTVRGIGYRLGGNDVSKQRDLAVCRTVFPHNRHGRGGGHAPDLPGGGNSDFYSGCLLRGSLFLVYQGKIQKNCPDVGTDRPDTP